MIYNPQHAKLTVNGEELFSKIEGETGAQCGVCKSDTFFVAPVIINGEKEHLCSDCFGTLVDAILANNETSDVSRETIDRKSR